MNPAPELFRDLWPFRVRISWLIIVLAIDLLLVWAQSLPIPNPYGSEITQDVYWRLTNPGTIFLMSVLTVSAAVRVMNAIAVKNRLRALEGIRSRTGSVSLGTYEVHLRPHLTTQYKISEAYLMAFHRNLVEMANFPAGGEFESIWEKSIPVGAWYRLGHRAIYFATEKEVRHDPRGHDVVIFDLMMQQ